MASTLIFLAKVHILRQLSKKVFSQIFLLGLVLFTELAFSLDYPISYESEFPEKQQVLFEKEWRNTLNLLPVKIQEELPINLSIVVKNLNLDAELSKQPHCDSSTSKTLTRYGRYNAIIKTLSIDYRLVDILINHEKTPLSCGHADSHQLAQATLLHELVHAWDWQTTVTKEDKKKRQLCLSKRQRLSTKRKTSLDASCQEILSSHYQLSDQAGLRKLGYWQAGWFLAQQKNTRPQRLADAYAYKNPREFLAVEMEYFLLDKNYRCRQPSLYHYFAKVFDHQSFSDEQDVCDYPVIAHYGELPVLKEIDPARIYRIDYLLAAAGDDIISNFGHSMFRLVVCAPARYSPFIEAHVAATPKGPACLQDEAFHLVVSFRANVDEVILNYWKGLTGAYASRPFILPYLQVKEEYTSDQLREMTLYPLQLNSTQQKQFLRRTLEQFWGYGGDYRFFTNNCAVESLTLVQSALPEHPINNAYALTPIGVFNALRAAELLDSADPAITVVPSKRDELKKLMAIAFPNDASEKIFSKDFVHYLHRTNGTERASWFPDTQDRSLQRVAALRRLEQQIKRMVLRELTLTARYNLYESAQNTIQALLSPLEMETLKVGGYGVPFRAEIVYDEALQLKQINTLRREVVFWLKTHRAQLWQEYQTIEHNLEMLDILALRPSKRHYPAHP